MKFVADMSFLVQDMHTTSKLENGFHDVSNRIKGLVGFIKVNEQKLIIMIEPSL